MSQYFYKPSIKSRAVLAIPKTELEFSGSYVRIEDGEMVPEGHYATREDAEAVLIRAARRDLQRATQRVEKARGEYDRAQSARAEAKNVLDKIQSNFNNQ